MNDKINNWYDFYENKYKKVSKDELDNESMYMKTFNNHYINSKNVLALLIGPSGSGKTTTIIDFITRTKNNNNYIPFYSIVYFTASTGDEQLIKLLKQLIPSTIIIDDANKLPKIDEFKNKDDFNNKLKNLIIFDDIGNLSKKQKDTIMNWSNSGRKIFSHLFFLCQNPIDIPTTIRRNCNYIFLYKTNELGVVERILKKYNIYNLPYEQLLEYFLEYTKEKGQFFLLDLTVDSKYKIRSNFLNILY